VYGVPYGYIHDWEVVDVEVRKPTNDNREKSYAVYNYEEEWDNLSKRIKTHKIHTVRGKIKSESLPREKQIELVRTLAKDTFSETRDKGKSFGMIKPRELKLVLEKNREKSEAQTKLTIIDDLGSIDLDGLVMNQEDYAWIPYLEYSCEGKCSSKHPHKQKIVEWGAYQHMKKSPNDETHCKRLAENYGIGDEDWEHYLLIGNLRKFPKTYVVVKIIRFKVK
jgi:hypothetical protein